LWLWLAEASFLSLVSVARSCFGREFTSEDTTGCNMQ
jgi:hypothetical protein